MSSVQKLGVPVIFFTIHVHGSLKSSTKGNKFLFATDATLLHSYFYPHDFKSNRCTLRFGCGLLTIQRNKNIKFH